MKSVLNVAKRRADNVTDGDGGQFWTGLEPII